MSLPRRFNMNTGQFDGAEVTGYYQRNWTAHDFYRVADETFGDDACIIQYGFTFGYASFSAVVNESSIRIVDFKKYGRGAAGKFGKLGMHWTDKPFDRS